MIRKIIMVCILGFAPVQAVLPPLYETIREYKALLEDPGLAKRLNSGEGIESIERHEDRFFVKSTKGKQLEIEVVYESQAMPGPAHFHFKFIESER